MRFLQAEWRKLVMFNYAVPAEMLAGYLPAGVELDLWRGKCYVSLVGFMFENTKVLGVKVPYHVNFEEVNLRFYVKREVAGEIRRGVVFIKEIVPKPMITFTANTLYNEHYTTLQMRHEFKKENDFAEYLYGFVKNKTWNIFGVRAGLKANEMPEGSDEEFFTEHYWGYTKVNEHTTREYAVKHPRWQAYPVISFTAKLPEVGAVYGHQWEGVFNKEPDSVLIAEGSPIEVLLSAKLKL
jgi:uncharacterized protein YqjF (DUF2071 family)